jgi:hypothetical protein
MVHTVQAEVALLPRGRKESQRIRKPDGDLNGGREK